MSLARPELQVRRTLEGFARDGVLDGGVRVDITESWQRSLMAGLAPDRLDVPCDDEFDPDGALVRAARPVLDSLGDDLGNTGVCAILADGGGLVLERHVEREFTTALDRISLAPGSVFAERTVGTNAIGTAVEQGALVFVNGWEHFADAFTGWTCAGVPVNDPRSGRLLGVLDLTCRAHDASPLMLPFARRAAKEIELRLVDQLGMVERLAVRRFLQLRRHTRGAFVFAYGDRMITNAAADRWIGPEDEILLWPLVTCTRQHRQPQVAAVELRNGQSVVLHGEPVFEGAELLGVLVRVDPAHDQSTGRSARSRQGPAFGWESLTEAERSVIDLVSSGLTNREIGARLFVSRHTVDFHLRSVYRKLAVTSRVELARLVVERAGS
jgi:transcriptional regulator of acetoin/glycerol metabolism/DNA-binding CsgD family transcriptional regulator